MESRNLQEPVQECAGQASFPECREAMVDWLRQAFQETRLTAMAIVDDLHAEIPPSLFYWVGDRSERLSPYRNAALERTEAEFTAYLRVGGKVRISISFEDIDQPIVVHRDIDHIGFRVPYRLATLFALELLAFLAPYQFSLTTYQID